MQQFGMGKPDFALEVGSGSHGAQTAKILERYEALLLEKPPSACVVLVISTARLHVLSLPQNWEYR